MEKTPFDRIEEEFAAGSLPKLCEDHLHVPLRTYENWKYRGEISKKGIKAISENTGLSAAWIEYGIGEKYIKEAV
ncbi:MAG TPA: hypothetical protein CFH81_08705 [Sulfurovum sp. UBA12169]|nr:MAG TPA: hypothetical protein CFH81_08705 [Sulfurovum sp. UBA12169]